MQHSAAILAAAGGAAALEPTVVSFGLLYKAV
jgi:hypothetical protein